MRSKPKELTKVQRRQLLRFMKNHARQAKACDGEEGCEYTLDVVRHRIGKNGNMTVWAEPSPRVWWKR